jgi:hypothetical protein
MVVSLLFGTDSNAMSNCPSEGVLYITIAFTGLCLSVNLTFTEIKYEYYVWTVSLRQWDYCVWVIN